MAFRGETSQISLTSIFQTLALGGQEGVLTVQIEGCTRRFQFSGSLLRLLSEKPGSPEPLQKILIKQKVLTAAQLANVVQTVDSNTRLGDALLDRGVIDDQFVGTTLRFHFEEIILETITWQGARFDFAPDPPTPKDEFFDPKRLEGALDFDVTALLMEAARREDEWTRIRSALPDPTDILVPVDEAAFRQALQELQVPERLRRDLEILLSGDRTLNQVAESSSFPSFHVFDALTALLGRNALRTLTAQEKKQLAAKLRRQLRLQDAATILRGVLKNDPQDSEARRLLASVLEQLNEKEELIEHWRYLAAQAHAEGKADEALQLLEKVVALEARNLQARADLLELYWERGALEEGLQVARELVQTARNHENPQEARPLVERCIELFPEELSFRHALAAICSRAGDQQAALRNLLYLADQYRKTGAVRSLRRTYEQIVKIDPSASRKLAQVLHMEAEQRAARLKQIRRLALRCAVALAVVGFVLFAAREVGAYRGLAEAREKVAGLVAASDFDQAAQVVEETARAYPFSSVQVFLKKLKHSVKEARVAAQEREERMRRDRRILYESRLASAKIALRKGRWDEADRLLASIVPEDLEPEEAQEAVRLRNKVRGYLEEAQRLHRKATTAVREGRWREAFAAYLKLITTYPEAPQSRNTTFPLKVESTPPGADVFVGRSLAGRTPCVIQWSPQRPVTVTIQKKGYRPYSRLLEKPEKVGWLLQAFLERVPTWRRTWEGTVEARAVAVGDVVVVADRSGRITALRPASGRIDWVKMLDDIGGVSADPVVWRNRVVCLSVEGSLYTIEIPGGAMTRKDFSFLAPARLDPSGVTSDGMVVFPSERGRLYGYSIAQGKLLWSIRMPGKISVPPAGADPSVVAADTAGNLWVLESRTGKRLRAHKLKNPPVARPIMLGDDKWVAACEGELVLGGAESKAEARLSAPPSASPVALGDIIVLPTRDGFLTAYAAEDLTFRWKVRLPAACHAVVACGGRLYLACGEQILAIDRTGKSVWRYYGTLPVRSLSLPAPGVLLAGTAGNLLVYFDLTGDR